MKRLFFLSVTFCFITLLSFSQSKNISDYMIDETTAMGMMKHKPIFSHNSKKIDSTLKALIPGEVTAYEAVYRQDDVERYTRTRGFTPGSEAGKVKNYKTIIFKAEVFSKQKGSANEIIYYDCVTLCPPPQGGCQ